ncbi:MAG: class I SAM-dependent methyltransferase [Sphingomonadales bacterium]
MTTREATSPLPRADGFPVSPSDRLMVLAFAPLQAPWLLKSLWGGLKRDKRRLLARLDLPANALPNLGSWKADTGFLHAIVDAIDTQHPQQVVELGAGASSLVIAQALQRAGGGRLSSYDQHEDFAHAVGTWLGEHNLSAEVRHAPLGTPPCDWPGRWYGLRAVPDRIDMLVIDGPQWSLHPFVRGAAEVLFGRIPVGGMIMLDDAARPGERIVARRWRRDWPNFDWTFRSGIKGTLTGVRRV